MNRPSKLICIGMLLAFLIIGVGIGSASTVINKDWIVSGNEVRSNEEIILYGNLIIPADASLTLDNVKLEMNGTSDGQRSITVQQWGKLYTRNSSEITGNFYYYFNNYGYLNLQNTGINRAYSIHFYDSSDDSSVITGSVIKDNTGQGIYLESASPSITNNVIKNSYQGIVTSASSALIEYNTISDQYYGIYSQNNYGQSSNIKNNIISNNTYYGIYFDYYGSPQIIGNIIENNAQMGLYLGSSTSAFLDDNIIRDNSNYGISSAGDNIINDSIISGSNYGIVTSYGINTVSNSTINSSYYDYTSYGGTIKSINTTFDKSKVSISGSGLLQVFWHDTIQVRRDYLPVVDANVEVYDNRGIQEDQGITGLDGKVKLKVQEYFQSSSQKFDSAPHLIRAFTDSDYGSINSTITETKQDVIDLNPGTAVPDVSIYKDGSWVINDTQSYSNAKIILHGDLIIQNGGSLTLDNTTLLIHLLNNEVYGIKIENGGKLYLNDSAVASTYPELGYPYYFNNYGYLNIQNSTVNGASSIRFYDSSDDSSVITGSVIKENKDQGIYLEYASPSITNNVIKNSNQGIYIAGSSALIENNTISDQYYGICSWSYSSVDSLIKNNIISNNTYYGIYFSYGSPQIIGNTIENNPTGLYLVYTSAFLDSNFILNNRDSGIQTTANTIINNSVISGSTYGISSSGDNITVGNSIINSTSYDYYVSGGTTKSVNTTFDKSKVYIPGGLLDVYWYDTIEVLNDSVPVSGALVEAYDKDLIKVSDRTTDENGKATLSIREYSQSSSTKTDANPHKLKASKSGFPDGSIESNITESKSDTIIMGQGEISSDLPLTINGDWVINDTQSYSNRNIVIDSGNLIIQNNGSLHLNNTQLKLRYTTNGGYGIKIENGGKLYLEDSAVAPSYPERGYPYDFINYGYLSIQNSTVSGASSINFYDSSDDSSVINGSVIKDNKNQGIYLQYASPSVTNNLIKNSNTGIYIAGSSGLIENNTISDQSYGIYSGWYDSVDSLIKNNVISNNTNCGINFGYYGSPQIIGNTIENNPTGLYLGSTSAFLDSNFILNSDYGIQASANTVINNSVISGGYYGIYSSGDNITVSNSIINSSSYDYYIDSGTTKSVNTTFDKSKVYIPGGLLDVYWYDTIEVLNDSVPVSGALVEAFDKDLTKVSDRTTDENGKATFSIREYSQSSSAKTDANPHKIKASKSGFPDGSIESNITESKSDTIIMGQGEISSDLPLTINGDWVINDTQSYSNRNIVIDSGNLIIQNNGSLHLNNTQLKLRYTTNGGYGIKIENGGKLYLEDSAVAPSYPERGYPYDFINYGYLSIQNSTVSGASSINFYDSSDDSSVINGSVIKDNKNQGIYLESASPSITNNVIKNSNQGISIYFSEPLVENNTISDQAYGIYSSYNYEHSLSIKNNIISNNTYSGIHFSYGGSPQIIGNIIENNAQYGLYGYYTSAFLDDNLIRNNSNYGVYSYYGDNIINNSIISGSNYGINSYGSNTVSNSAINSSYYDYAVYDGTLKSINSTFDKSKVSISGGLLDVYWYDTIEVLNDSVPVSGALVEAFDKDSIKDSEGTTDENGKAILSIREYIQYSGAKIDANPHKIKASKAGFPDGSIESDITGPKSDTIVLGQGELSSDLPLTINGDWVINDTQSYADKTIYLNGNLNVQNGGSLTLDNVTLLIQLSGPDKYGINVQNGGELNLRKSFLSPAHTELGFYYPFNVYGLLNVDNSTIKMATSVNFDSLSDENSTIIDSTIVRNRDYGLQIQSNPKISGNLLQYNGNGILASSRINVSDSKIADSSQYDYIISWDSEINSINTSFDTSKVYQYYSNSILDNSWYLNVKTVDANGNPISNANISVNDSTGTQIFSGSTDAEGLVKNIVVKEYSKTPATITYYNHMISATFDSAAAQTSVHVDSNKEVELSLDVNQPLKVTVLTPENNSIFVQNDSVSFNALGFDPDDGILKDSAIEWTSSLDGFIGSGESFNSSSLSLGTHQITAKATNSKGESVNYSVNIQVIGRSDLNVGGINWDLTQMNEGEVVTFNASIRNIGNGYTLSPFYVRFLIDNQYIGQKRIERLNASESIVVNQEWTPTAYAKNVTVVVDYYNNVEEIDETNNRFTASLSELPDTTSPVIESVLLSPTSTTTNSTIEITVNVTDNVRVSGVKANDVDLINHGGSLWNGSITALEGTHSVNVSAVDEAGNVAVDDSASYTATTPDIEAPAINSVSLSDSTPDTGDSIVVSVDATDNIGVSSVEASGVPLANTGENIWEGSIVAVEGTHSVNVSAVDGAGNIAWDNSTSYTALTPDTTAPSSIANLQSTNGTTWINWTWQNPTDPDFNHTEIYLNGIFQTDISAEYFNATGLQPETDYTISTRTVDINGNVNETWVNASVKTLALPDTDSPVIESVVLSPTSTTTGSTIEVTVDVTDNIVVSGVKANDVDLINQGGSIWNGSITALEGTHSVTVSAVDGAGNIAWNNSTAYTATTPDTTAPSSVSDLQSTNGTTWINWTWQNPTDPDFNHTEIYLNGAFQTNTFAEYFNATGLQPETDYTISTRTVDVNENVNEAWVNATATTGAEIFTENFNVSISTDKSIYDREETVHITGKAQYEDENPVVNAPAVLNIKLKGYTQTFNLVTDSNGNLSYDFKPGKTEAGNFTAKLSVNSNGQLMSAETSFNVYGLYMIPSGTLDCEMSKNSSENITFSLRNYGETDLHGVTVQLDGDTVTGVETQVLQAPPETLAAGAQGSFIVKISSTNVEVSQADYTVRVTTDEGSYEEAKLFVHLVDAFPAAVVSPTSIIVGINPNDTLVKTVNISNIGHESMNDITISKPSLDWVSVSSTSLGSISPGMDKTFNIFLHPGSDTAVGVYQETITISSSNHQPVNIYLSISVTSSEKGDLMFHVVNDIGENISGASVAIQNPVVPTEIFQGIAGENGYYTFKNISTGTYNYYVTASGHSPVSGSSTVSPGIQTLTEPILTKGILGVKLNVAPVQIGDDYDILLNLTFETDVPSPLLIPSPLWIIHEVDSSDPVYEHDSYITISNPGLISVFNVTVDSSSLQGVNISFPTGQTFFIDEIKAESSITIPYHLKVTDVDSGGLTYRNSIRISGDYIFFEPRSDITHNAYLSSEIPVFTNIYDSNSGSGTGGGSVIGDGGSVISGGSGDGIIEYFKYIYSVPVASYSPIYINIEPIPQVVETVHERVKFNIPQKATLERDGFAANLELTNKLSDQNIENVSVNLTIKDKDGNDASSLFFVNLTSLSNINSIDGSGVISPSSAANSYWLFVPENNAGGTDPSGRDYTVQALINYTVNGVSFSINSTEESITVMPQPLLNLTYTLPENVTADKPFNLTLNVANVGYGTAKNLKLDSGQPMIYENKAGLLVSFELIGSGLVNGPESNSMLIDFGDLAPGESKEAYWVMKTSLDGNFTEFYGSFSHSNALGGSETSLINDIRYIIVKESDTNPPSSITNLQSVNGTTWINWTWTNPADPDFSHTEIYLNGILKTYTLAEYFNATDLQPETNYTIGTRTVDIYGNVNDTWVNSTATTLKAPLSVFPGYTNSSSDLDQDGLYEDINGNGILDFDDVVAYYDNMDWIEENVPLEFFDYNSNGGIDFDDVVKLYDML